MKIQVSTGSNDPRTYYSWSWNPNKEKHWYAYEIKHGGTLVIVKRWDAEGYDGAPITQGFNVAAFAPGNWARVERQEED